MGDSSRLAVRGHLSDFKVMSLKDIGTETGLETMVRRADGVSTQRFLLHTFLVELLFPG